MPLLKVILVPSIPGLNQITNSANAIKNAIEAECLADKFNTNKHINNAAIGNNANKNSVIIFYIPSKKF